MIHAPGKISLQPPDLHRDRLIAWFPITLFFLNFLTKILYLTFYDISHDEPFSIYHAQFKVPVIIDQLKNYNNPPLYEIVLHYWMAVFGSSPFSVRLLPMLFACLSPVALFYFAKRFFSPGTAIAAGLLLTASTLLVYYSHDCRVYSLFLLLSILSMHFFMLFCRNNDRRSLFYFIISSTLLIYAHYFGLIVLLLQGLHLLLFSGKKIPRFFFCYVVILLLYLPHLYPMITRFSDSVGHGTWLQPPSGIDSLYNMVWSFSNYPLVTVGCMVLLVSALLKKLLEKRHFKIKKEQGLILLWFLLPFFGLFFISYKVPVYISRYLIFITPAYYLLLALSTEYLLGNFRYRNLGFILLVAAFCFTIELNPDKKRDLEKTVTDLKKMKDDSTAVIIAPFDYINAFSYYYNRNYFSAVEDNREYHLTDSLLRQDNIFLVNHAHELPDLQTRRFTKLIYLGGSEGFCSAANEVASALQSKYIFIEKKNLNTSCCLQFFITGNGLQRE